MRPRVPSVAPPPWRPRNDLNDYLYYPIIYDHYYSFCLPFFTYYLFLVAKLLMIGLIYLYDYHPPYSRRFFLPSSVFSFQSRHYFPAALSSVFFLLLIRESLFLCSLCVCPSVCPAPPPVLPLPPSTFAYLLLITVCLSFRNRGTCCLL